MKIVMDTAFMFLSGLQSPDFRMIYLSRAENFNSQALYNAAVKHKTAGLLWEGLPEWGFSQTKRYLMDDVLVYKFSAEKKDLVRVTDDWLPLVLE